ncbi:MAG: 30S ribosomal protein S6 [Planctomycetota bacterium]|nr:30S ribosomal protein S6 [Planctomycetota bacterium]MCX8040702.1 30S ribosomal protein S6 [Planctomycetota bacterium]MDW8373460.1 30S ribosomal protein S6 [Planctomycetota bacterium]
MTETFRTYETTILVKAAEARADLEGMLAAIRQLYEAEGASFIELEKWEERTLAYPIKGETSACYFTGYFRAPPSAIERIERRANLGTLILRQLIVARPGKQLDRIREQRARAKAAAQAAPPPPAES